MKKLIPIIAFLFLFSCKSKIDTTSTFDKRDSIIRIEKIVYTPGATKEIIIEKPCDSLGILKDFEREFVSGGNTVILRGSNGVMTTRIVLAPSIDKFVSENRDSVSKERIVQTVTVKRKIAKFWWYLLGYSILATVYIFRRFIPFLQFLP